MTAELGNHLLVPIGFDVASRHAKQFALQLALRHSSRITLLHVLPELEREPPPKTGLDAIACLQPPVGNFLRSPEYLEAARAYTLDRLSRELHSEWKDLVNWDVACRIGDVRQQVLRFAKENGVDTIVLGGKRTAWHWARSNLTDQIVSGAPCPVLVVWDSKESAKETPRASLFNPWRKWLGFWQRQFGLRAADEEDAPANTIADEARQRIPNSSEA